MLIKNQAVADMFYPKDKNTLIEMIKKFFENISLKENYSGIKAAVCPHAGYIYSGQTSSYSYKIIKDNWQDIKQKTIILLCPSHYERFDKVSIGLYDELETPLGNIKVDKELGQKIISDYSLLFSFYPKAHEKEHSLETQLPFLKYLAAGDDFKVLPLIFSETNPILVGDVLAEISKQNDVFFIVSSDLSHYEEYFVAQEIDNKSINNFLSKDTEKIISSSKACGIYPWLALNQIAIKNNWNPKLIHYSNSGDTAGTKDKVVGYTSIIYK